MQGATDGFRALADVQPVSGDDLLAWGDALWWLGQMAESIVATEGSHKRWVAEGRANEAAGAAVVLAVNPFQRGDQVLGGLGGTLLPPSPGPAQVADARLSLETGV